MPNNEEISLKKQTKNHKKHSTIKSLLLIMREKQKTIIKFQLSIVN
jgi:hypothetical protein